MILLNSLIASKSYHHAAKIMPSSLLNYLLSLSNNSCIPVFEDICNNS